MDEQEQKQALEYLKFFVSWLKIRNYNDFAGLMIREADDFLRAVTLR